MKIVSKILKGILIALALVLFIIIIISAIMLFMIHDNTNDTDPTIAKNNISLEDALYTQFEESLNDTEETGIMSIDIDQYDLNEILYALSKKAGDLGLIKINSMYAINNDGVYTFFVPTKVMGVSTCAKGNLTIEEKNGTFIITINSLSLGNCKFDSSFINLGINLFNVKKTITNKLNEMYIDSTFKNDTIVGTITRENLGKLLFTQINNEETGDLIHALYNVFLIETDAVKFDIKNPFSMKATIDLNTFNGTKDTSLDTANSFTKEYLTSHDYNSINSSLVTKFYITGYNYLNSEEKDTIRTLLSDTWTTEKIITHKGLIERKTTTFKDVLESQVPTSIGITKPGFKITEADFNGNMSQMEFVGFSIGFSSYKTNDTAFVAIQALETEIKNDYVELYIDININGYKLRIHAGLESPKSRGLKIVSSLDQMDIGSISLSEESKDLIFSYLSKVLKENWISADYEQKKITFNFTEIFADSILLNPITQNNPLIETAFIRDTKGYLNISLL